MKNSQKALLYLAANDIEHWNLLMRREGKKKYQFQNVASIDIEIAEKVIDSFIESEFLRKTPSDFIDRYDQIITKLFHRLDIPSRYISIIKYRYGLLEGSSKKTLEETAKEFGVTRERIRQIEEKIFGSMQSL